MMKMNTLKHLYSFTNNEYREIEDKLKHSNKYFIDTDLCILFIRSIVGSDTQVLDCFVLSDNKEDSVVHISTRISSEIL